MLPLSGSNYGNTVTVEGRTVPEGSDSAHRMIPGRRWRLRGNTGEPASARPRHLGGDVDRGELVTVVNKAMAEAYFPARIRWPAHLVERRDQFAVADDCRRGGEHAVGGVENHARLKVYMPMSIAGGPDVPVAQLMGPSSRPELRGALRPRQRRRCFPACGEAIDAVDAKLALSQVMTLEICCIARWRRWPSPWCC